MELYINNILATGERMYGFFFSGRRTNETEALRSFRSQFRSAKRNIGKQCSLSTDFHDALCNKKR
jgi:hypothetical protein